MLWVLIRSASPSRKHAYIFDPRKPHFLYSKSGVYRGRHTFFYFCSKHRLWVLVRTASPRRFSRVPTIYVLSRNMKKIRVFLSENFQFLEVKFSIYLNRRVFVMAEVLLMSTCSTFYMFLWRNKCKNNIKASAGWYFQCFALWEKS